MTRSIALLVFALLPGQEPPSFDDASGDRVRLLGATLSSRSVELGQPFELSIMANVPSGHIVRFPDTLVVENGIESAAPVQWRARPAVEDSVELTIVYPLRAFAVGTLTLPDAEILLRPHTGGQTGEGELESAGSDVWIEPWRSADPTSGGFTRRPISPGTIEVEMVLPLSRPEEGFRPRPPADVMGPNWGRSVLALISLSGFGLVIGVSLAVGRMVRRVRDRAPRRSEPVVSSLSPRHRALSELDGILDSGLHTSGKMDVFYARSTLAARRYIETLDRACGPWLTDRELVGRLSAAGANGAAEPLGRVLRRAEGVRFGTRRPDPATAVADLAVLRDWVSGYPPGDASA
ncbi:MAG: hypothetical protein WD737_01990 [Gemmatimonadota bacterium]